MAQLNSRGTMTRGRWDFFEHSNGISSIYGSVVSGTIGAYFANNSTGATAVDIYTVNFMASVAGSYSIGVFMPPLVLTPLAPSEQNVMPLQPDLAAPPGINGMFTANAGAFKTLVRFESPTTLVQFAPIMGSYFVTLPPGWAIYVFGNVGPNPCELNMSVWFQYVTDNIAPAQ